jgi:hypothetical protein
MRPDDALGGGALTGSRVNLELLASCSPAIAAAHGGVDGGGGGISIGRSDRGKAVHVEMLAAHVNIDDVFTYRHLPSAVP